MLAPNENRWRLDRAQSVVFWQIVRFVLAGVGMTTLGSGLYYLIVTYTPTTPALSLTLATIIGSVVGYFVHGRFSFQAHGFRDEPAKRFVRFLTTNGIAYLLNMAHVVTLVHFMHLPEWTPIIGFCLVTPAVSFALNRYWVFR